MVSETALSNVKGATYSDPLHVEMLVSIRVPKSGGMERVSAHEFTSGEKLVQVADHWKNGAVVSGAEGRTLIVQRNFFGLDPNGGDFGHKITADVEVVEKTTSRGATVMLLNITKREVKPLSDLSFAFNGEGCGITFPAGVTVAFVRRKGVAIQAAE